MCARAGVLKEKELRLRLLWTSHQTISESDSGRNSPGNSTNATRSRDGPELDVEKRDKRSLRLTLKKT